MGIFNEKKNKFINNTSGEFFFSLSSCSLRNKRMDWPGPLDRRSHIIHYNSKGSKGTAR